MKKYTVSEVAAKTGVAPTTIYGMIERGELAADLVGGVLQLDEPTVRAMPKRPVGHPRSKPRELIGAGYAAALRALPEDSDQSVNIVAAAYGVTPSAVRDALARYKKAIKGLHKANP